VSEKKIIKDFINEPPPVDIPSTDYAWEQMQQRLGKEEKRRRIIGWRWVYTAALLLLLTGTGWWVFTNKNFKSGKETINKKAPDQASSATVSREENKSNNERERRPKEEELQAIKPALPEAQRMDESRADESFKQHKQQLRKASQRQVKNSGRSNLAKREHAPSVAPAMNVNSNGDKGSLSSTDTSTIKDQANLGAERGKDSIKKEEIPGATEKEKDVQKSRIIQAGLQWNAQLRATNLREYFDGPNGSSQPYRLLLPSVWVSLQVEKSMLAAQLNPFAYSVLSNKPYATKDMGSGAGMLRERRTLNKVFGISAGFGFDYNVKDNWWLGGNLQGIFWRKGAAILVGENINTSNGSTSFAYRNNYQLTDTAWAGFSKFQMGLGAQLLYKKSKLQAGIRGDFSPVILIDEKGQKNQVWAGAFIRLALYSHEKKVK
jgi:hypothetical protein